MKIKRKKITKGMFKHCACANQIWYLKEAYNYADVLTVAYLFDMKIIKEHKDFWVIGFDDRDNIVQVIR